MKYLYDTHVHTKESSKCGETCAADIVARYKSLGYDGICITDHIHTSGFNWLGGATYDEQVENWLKGYRTAKAFEDENFTVILGMELRFKENDNDYLVFGFDEDFLHSMDLANIETLEDFAPIAKKNNLVVIQAHPFREGMTVKNPDLVDGFEVYNGHGGHDSRNPIARAWAERFSKLMTSGSDFHYVSEKEHGGIYFEERLLTSRQVADAILKKNYTLKNITE